jgi:DNA invertase Pin-like site-specific DNA recombinase
VSSCLRCAVYTRKSSEEGLEQSFNSLGAQREAGRDYIKSQKHQGWTAVSTHYDDGGYSGGTTQRPALQRLLDDIARGRVDVVVVYKVDRLSRSLADFARLMQTFDEHKVSFVSVTQQFNTTTSMGRLTLNMLLSFAQFEREVPGERIRDKIAATKRRGVWVAGRPPLGYRVSRPDELPGDRRLRIVEHEAATIRAIFAAYLELRSPLAVAQRMNDAGHTTRAWKDAQGSARGGNRFNAATVKKIICNPVYAGKITHRRGDKLDIHPGLHEPIIDEKTWDKVQSSMTRVERSRPTRWTHTHLLRGKIRTFEDYALSPGSVQKSRAKTNGAPPQRVFYYCSQKALKEGYRNCPIKSINAGHLDNLVRAVVLDHLNEAHGIDLRGLEAASRDHWIREAIHRVVLAPEAMTIGLEPGHLEAWREAALGCSAGGGEGNASLTDPLAAGASTDAIPRCLFTPEVEERDGRTVLTLHLKIKRHDTRRVVVAPDGRDLFLKYTPDGAPIAQEGLVRIIGQAFSWHREVVVRGETLESVAKDAGITPRRIAHLLVLTRLSPTIIHAVLAGRLGPSTRVQDLQSAATHLDWSLQQAALGIDHQR